MEELAAASRTAELSGALRGFAALGECLESAGCDLEDGVLSEIVRLAELRERLDLAERLDALRRLGTSLATPERAVGSDDPLEELARFALPDNPEAARRFENLAILDSLLGSGGHEARILRGLASYIRSGAVGARSVAGTNALDHDAPAGEALGVEAPPTDYGLAARVEALADLGDLVYSDSGEEEILSGVATLREAARAREAFHESDNLQLAAGPDGDPIAVRLSELAGFNRLLRLGAREDEMLDAVANLLPADQPAVSRLAGLAELSRILDSTAVADTARVADSLEGLAQLLQATSPGEAARIRSLAVVSDAVDGASDGAESRALTALADLFPAAPAEPREHILALSDLDQALGSQHPASAVAILRQASGLAARDNPTTASTLSALKEVVESIAYPSAVAVPAALGSVATLFDQGSPVTGATVRSLGVIGSVVHSSPDKAVPRTLERAQRGLSKKSPEASAAFGQLARLSEVQVAQARADGTEKKGTGGGFLRALLLTSAAVVVGEENAAAGDALARVASGESIKNSALQGAADFAGQGELDEVIGDTGAALVAGLSEGMMTGTPPPVGTGSATSSPSDVTPSGSPIAILPPNAIGFSNATHGWIDRSDAGWTFRWQVTVTNTTSGALDVAIRCNLDSGPDSHAALASDVVNVHLEAGQVLDLPRRTFTVDPVTAERATSVGIFARPVS
jgi:hypothetical protein